MDDYPIFDDDGEEELSFPNMWRAELPQTMEGSECFMPDAPIYPDENWVVLKLTGEEYLKLFSSLYVGSEFAYPDQYLQILTSFMKGTNCPPIMPEQECFEYPSYASFVAYSPQNPFLEPDTTPEGYLTPPFVQVTEDNIDEFPSYQVNDIIVAFGSLTLDVDWFDDISGQLPTIQIHVQGEGDVDIKFLNVVQGGLVIVTLDNPPDILDIIGGIISGGDHILDVNLDSISLPPETATEIIYSVHTEGEGEHIIYCVFCPIVDDSLLPLRFGGGFRGVELCNFVEQPEMGITAIRYQMTLDPAQRLQYLVDGVWTDTEGWPILESRIDDIDEVLSNHNDRIVSLEGAVLELENGQEVQDARLDALEAEDIVLHDEIIIVADAADFAQSTADDALAYGISADAAAAVADAKAQDALDQNVVQDARLDALESDLSDLSSTVSGKIPSQTIVYDFKSSDNSWSVVLSQGSYSSGVGFNSTAGGHLVLNRTANPISDGNILYIRALIKRNTGGSALATIEWCTNDTQDVQLPSSGSANFNVKMGNFTGGSPIDQHIEIDVPSGGTFTLEKLTLFLIYP